MITDKGEYLEFYEPDKIDTWLEDAHQISCVSWMRYHHPELLFWHTVNEGRKHIHAALRDEQAGLIKGVSDFVILIGLSNPGGKYQFAAIELKRTNKSGKGKASPVSDDQKSFLKRVRDLGGFAAVAYGKEQFKLAIEEMLK